MTTPLWYIYLSAAVAAHLIRLVAYMKQQQPGSLKNELMDFYFGGQEASLTTVGTIGIIWVLGSVYIDKLGVSFLNLVVNLPLHPALAFLLGFMGEFFGPKIIKAIYHWFTPGGE
jgi:hypothetical protein